MVPIPIALGLTLCDRVMIEEGNRNITLVSCFTRLSFPVFPAPAVSFVAFAPMVGSQGTGNLQLALTRLENDETLRHWQAPVSFPNRFLEVRVRFTILNFVFPAPGRYQFTLLVDGEWAAQRDLLVLAEK